MTGLATRIGLAALAIGMAAAGRAEAGQIIDQQNRTLDYYSDASSIVSSFGQSFAPELSLLNFITAQVAVNSAASYRVDLFSGEGFGGPLLGSSSGTALSISATRAGVADAQFDFAAPVALTAGSTYSFRLIRVSGSNTSLFAGISFPADRYTRGNYLESASGFPDRGVDLVFSEGINDVVATPEPSTLVGCASAALVGLGVAARRRRRAA